MTVRELIVKVVFKDDKNSVEKTTKKIDRSFKLIQDRGSKMGRILSAAMGRVVITAGDIAEAIAAVGRAFARVAELAGEETSALNVAGVAFGKLSDETIAWARTTARQVGVADAKLITLTSRIQLSLAKITGGIEQGAIATKKLVPLGVGIARAFGRPVEDALFAITRGIQGEEEQLRKFGIETTDAALKQFAFEKGLKRSISSLTQNEKALLRYAKILEETRDFQKFATKGLKTYGGALAALKGRLETLGATIGQKVQPFFVSLFNKTRLLVDEYDKAISSTKGLVEANDPLAETLGNVTRTSEALWRGLTGLVEIIVNFVKESKAAQAILLVIATIFAGWLIALFPLVALVGILFVALDDFFAFLDGQDSIIGDIVDNFEKFKNTIKGIPRLVSAMASELKNKFIEIVVSIKDDLFQSLGPLAQILGFGERREESPAASVFIEPPFQMAGATAAGGTATFTGDIIVQQSINGSSADNASAIGAASASALGQGMAEQLRKTSRDLSQ